MITEESKYIASVFKIFGVACFTPFGQFILNIREEIIRLSFTTFIYMGFILFVAFFGIILISKGSDHVTERIERKWLHK